MKKLTLLTILFTLCISFCKAQDLESFLPPNSFSDSLSKVVLDFKNNYKKIEGTNLPAQTQENVTVYNSIITLPKSLHCVIYRFNSTEDPTASWQAIMYAGDDYAEALKQYKRLFHLVKRTSIKWIDKSRLNFAGSLELPKDNVSFATSLLRLDAMDKEYAKFVAEIEITNADGGYEVHLNLQNKRKDSDQY